MDTPAKPEAPQDSIIPTSSSTPSPVTTDSEPLSAPELAAQPAPTSPPTATVASPIPGTVPPPLPPKKSKLPILGIGLVIVLLLIFVSGLFYLRQNLYKQISSIGQMSDREMAAMNEKETGKESKKDLSSQQLVRNGVLTIGSDTTFQPMEYKDEKGETVGYSVDLGKEIAKEMGVKAEVKTIVWDDIFKALDNKEIDVIMSSVSITDERKKKYGFSEPYLNAGQVILTRKATSSITMPLDLKNKKVGAQVGTTSLEQAKKYEAVPVSYPDPDVAVADLVKGTIEAVIADLPAAKGYVDTNPTLKIASDPFTSEYYGIVFRKDDATLRDHINQILTDLQQKGVLADLKEKWLE